MKIGLAGRAAEQVVFGRVTNGAASDLEKVTLLARAMVFEYGMSEGVVSRTMRADNYALSEETKRLRDQRAGAAHGRRVPRGRPAAREAPLGARPGLRRAAREGDARRDEIAEPARRRRARVPALQRDGRHDPRRSAARGPSGAPDGPLRTQLVSPRGSIGRAGAALDPPPRRRRRGSRRGRRDVRAPVRRRARAPRTRRGAGRRGGLRRIGESRVELLAALGEETPVGKFLAKRGPGMHHVAYEVDDIPRRLSELAERGAS